MDWTRRALVLGVMLCAVSIHAEQPAAVQLESVKHDELLKIIKSYQGKKVVLVDFWADYCIPCKKKFPKVVELYNKHRKDGFVVITVSLDGKLNQAKAFRFLTQQNATFPNYILDDSFQTFARYWQTQVIPAHFVFDKEGKLVGKSTMKSPLSMADLEKIIISGLE